MSVNNEAFLMKLGWGILSEPDSLWVAVLRSKYVKSDAVIPDLKAWFISSVERDWPEWLQRDTPTPLLRGGKGGGRRMTEQSRVDPFWHLLGGNLLSECDSSFPIPNLVDRWGERKHCTGLVILLPLTRKKSASFVLGVRFPFGLNKKWVNQLNSRR